MDQLQLDLSVTAACPRQPAAPPIETPTVHIGLTERIANFIAVNGFAVKAWQEEDQALERDAEIEILPNLVVQIDTSSGQHEYSLTVEAYRTQQERNTAFRHVGYFMGLDALLDALRRTMDGSRTPQSG